MPIYPALQSFLLSLFIALTHYFYSKNFFIILVIALLAVGLTVYFLYKKYIKVTIVAIVTIIFALIISCWQIHRVKANLNSIVANNQVITATGTIIGLPIEKYGYILVDFKPDKSVKLPGIIRLSWRNPPDIIPGEIWQLTFSIRRPHNFSSYNTFDAEAYYIRQNIYLRGSVKSATKIAASAKNAQMFTKIRLKLRSLIKQNISEETASILVALLVGDKYNITHKTWKQLNISGTTHLVVISGLHIGLIIAFAIVLAKILALIGCLPLNKLPLTTIAAFIAILLSLLYSALAGFSIPVQRALVMSSITLLSPLLGFRVQKTTQLLFAVVIVHFIDPICSTSQSFWLSFIAVSALMLGMHADNKSVIKKYLKPHIAIFLVLTPVLLYMHKEVSLISPIINMIAIPAIGFLVVPLLLLWAIITLITTKPMIWLLWFPAKVVSIFTTCLAYLEQLPKTTLNFYFQDITPAILAIIAGIFLIAPQTLRLNRFIPFLLLPAIFPRENQLAANRALINVLDVGQGLAIIVKTKSHVLLYDTGDKFSPDFTAAKQVIIPALRALAIKKIDKIVISHADRDHAGGLPELAMEYPTEIISSMPIDGIKQQLIPCSLRKRWIWDEVLFEIISSGSEKKNNDSSCILKITANNQSILLTGDISSKKEIKLIKATNNLASQVLIAPHHGSKYSSCNEFLSAVNPQTVIVSAGYLNKFQHPAIETLQRYNQLGLDIYNTAENGTISFKLGDLQDGYKLYRNNTKNYWIHD